jgi:hypothetical protein
LNDEALDYAHGGGEKANQPEGRWKIRVAMIAVFTDYQLYLIRSKGVLERLQSTIQVMSFYVDYAVICSACPAKFQRHAKRTISRHRYDLIP